MTEINLCNEVLQNAIGVHRSLEKIEPLNPMDAVAVQAMEELLKYRAIGTVEDLKSMKENGSFTGVELASLACMQMKLKDYQVIGTIEEFKTLKGFKKTITEIVDRQLIAGSNNYKEIYDCFQEIAKVVQDNY